MLFRNGYSYGLSVNKNKIWIVFKADQHSFIRICGFIKLYLGKDKIRIIEKSCKFTRIRMKSRPLFVYLDVWIHINSPLIKIKFGTYKSIFIYLENTITDYPLKRIKIGEHKRSVIWMYGFIQIIP